MSDQTTTEFRSIILSSLIMSGTGWAGLYLLFHHWYPSIGPRWMLFFLATIAITGTSLPFIWLLHHRFDSDQPVPQSTIIRQGLLVGFYAALCIWLQINRNLTLTLVLLLAAGLAFFDNLLSMIKRGTWRPGP